MNPFRGEGERLFWARLDDGRVLDRPTGEPILADDAYVVVRLAEMYLGTSRVLWRKLSPLVHVFVTYRGAESHSVAGPGQLQLLGDAGLERTLVLNLPLAGPIPYRGGDLTLLGGLYAVPRRDAAAALVEAIAALAPLVGPGGAAAGTVAQVVKHGVDSILGLGETALRLGVSDTFGGGGNVLRSGFHVGIGAPAAEVPATRLWMRDGRLVDGNSPALADPYTGRDYFVLQVERLPRRSDWSGIAELAPYERRFGEILRGAGDDAALDAAYREFTAALMDSPALTRSDAAQIATEVKADVLARREAHRGGGLFEPRGAGGEPQAPEDMDFAYVPELAAQPGGQAPPAGLF